MESCKEANTPMPSSCYMDVHAVGKGVDQTKYRGLIGSLLYLTAIRPDIMFAVCLCARYQANPKESHFKGCKLDRKSTSGTCHLFGSSLISWYSKKKACVALSTAEAEDRVSNGDCEVKFVETKLQLADIFTKPLPKERFFFLRNELGILDLHNLS
ncbi:uncharacterized mitochondrial protein AtMg00810-like [Phaseolus vulgaris]|uniref:uncharacterized mitochondrial protein AtMg00810-like n=1 Tax=Phaseolus vulgaris TaxID=3885 RepID=UPI0035CA5159